MGSKVKGGAEDDSKGSFVHEVKENDTIKIIGNTGIREYLTHCKRVVCNVRVIVSLRFLLC